MVRKKLTQVRSHLTADTLWKLHRVGGVALAPDGTRAVVPVTLHGATSLWLLRTDRCAPRRLTLCGDRDAQPAWSPSGDCIAFVTRRAGDDAAQLYLIPADGGEAERKTSLPTGVESFQWLPDGKRIVFASWTWPDTSGAAAQSARHKALRDAKESGIATDAAYYRFWDHDLPAGRGLRLWLLQLSAGRLADLFAGTRFELPRSGDGNDSYDVSPDGRRVVFVHDPAPEPVLGNPLALSAIDLRTRRVTPLTADAAWDYTAPRHSPGGTRIAALAYPVGFKHTALAELVLIEPGAPRRLTSGWDRAIDAPLRWDGNDALVFAAEDRGRRHLWRLVPGGVPQCVHAGGWVQSHDVANGVLALTADSALHPPRVVARRGGAEPLRLDRFNDALLRRTQLGSLREVTLRGARGDAVQMWLLLPPGFKPKRRHACVHVLHGGPFSASGDSWSWRWNAHVLAGRDTVLAQVNFHGSSGFGFDFRDSIIGRQGALELQDIEAGTDWLLDQRWCDPKRVSAAGGSYGGFLVAWMNGHVAPGRYRRYVCHAGVFDRIATFAADSYPERPKDLGALYWHDMPKVLAQSPAHFAAAMHTPTLVVHGARDFRVPDCNGLAYYNTLKARCVAARLLWFADEGHWVLKEPNSKLWYREVNDWLRLDST